MPRHLPFCLSYSLFAWLCLCPGWAQDTTLTLTKQMFNPSHRINLTPMNGWVYYAGHNPAWMTPSLNTADWTIRKPTDLSVKDTNQNGRINGWFRLRIRLDSSFNGLPLAFEKSSWSAVDLYLDGHWLSSFGSTGTSTPYAEHNPYIRPSLPVRLDTERDHLIALHVVDERSPFSSTQLKSEVEQLNQQLIQLYNPPTDDDSAYEKTLMLNMLWLIVPLVFAMLFWSLSLLDLSEQKVIRLLAIWVSLLTLIQVGSLVDLFHLPFEVELLSYRLSRLCFYGSTSLIVIILARVLRYWPTPHFNRIIIGLSLVGILCDIVANKEDFRFTKIAALCQILVFFWLLFAARKNLRGTQWVIVVGTGLTVLVFLFDILGSPSFLNFSGFLKQVYLTTGIFLTLPACLLLYVVLRFKSTLDEVRANAAAVVQVTEEKQNLLVTQNERLEQQVEQRTAELKASQVQLIQKEKLASLGELTAGIAHEIQNPLNFVNNFSEVSAELIDELKEEAQAGHTDDVMTIADDLRQNLQKIHQHGGRASRIIKGMLEHSRISTGERQFTDLNALADEYLRLAYQGQRAKDKAFQCALITHFDSAAGKVEIVPQEIGRVLLNLYNNAFYAVQQRDKGRGQVETYQPTVSVSTHQLNGQTEIRVSDNGTGIPESVKAKIFQPFFTTKPTGEGTGLGLSLSYDIITKGHGGSLTAESQVGVGSAFTIQLPQPSPLNDRA